MPSESKVVRSDRFTLSITGFALITLTTLIIFIGSSAQANACVLSQAERSGVGTAEEKTRRCSSCGKIASRWPAVMPTIG